MGTNSSVAGTGHGEIACILIINSTQNIDNNYIILLRINYYYLDQDRRSSIDRGAIDQIVNGARELYVGIVRPAFSVLVTTNSFNMSHTLTVGHTSRTENSWLQDAINEEIVLNGTASNNTRCSEQC